MERPILVDQFADNGDLSHWHLVNAETGEVLWSSFPEETIARGEKISGAVSPTYVSDEEIRTQSIEKTKDVAGSPAGFNKGAHWMRSLIFKEGKGKDKL